MNNENKVLGINVVNPLVSLRANDNDSLRANDNDSATSWENSSQRIQRTLAASSNSGVNVQWNSSASRDEDLEMCRHFMRRALLQFTEGSTNKMPPGEKSEVYKKEVIRKEYLVENNRNKQKEKIGTGKNF